MHLVDDGRGQATPPSKERKSEPGTREVRPTSFGDVRGQEWSACTLALVAGYTDAYGFIHYQAYVSFMSGNTTQSGLSLGRGAWSLAVPTMLAIASFIVGVFAGTSLAHSGSSRSPRVRYGLVAAIMTGIIVATVRESLPLDLEIMVLSFAMGIMNTTLSQVGGEAVALGYVSGTLNSLARHLALACKRLPLTGAQGPWDTHWRRALLLAGVWVAFLAGAALSTAVTERFGAWILLLPIAVLAGLAVSGHPAGAGAGSEVT